MTRSTSYRDHAHQLRSEYLAARLERFLSAMPRARTAALAITGALLLALAAGGAASAQPAADADDAVLAPYGTTAARLAGTTDVPLLWNVTRDLVLTERVSAATGQTVLRRLWMVDRDVPVADTLDIHPDMGVADDMAEAGRVQTGDRRGGTR